jgi:hypothetical protein
LTIDPFIPTIVRDRLRGVRDRIDRKIMEQIQPKDLFYQDPRRHPLPDPLRPFSALLIRETIVAINGVAGQQNVPLSDPRQGIRPVFAVAQR